MNISLYKSPIETVVKHSLNNMSEAKETLMKRLSKNDFLKFDFKENVKDGRYRYDFFSKKLNLAIQLDAYSYCYDETYNFDKIKALRISDKNITVLKLTDYQVFIDLDEVVRYIKNKNEFINFNKLIA